MRRIDGLQCNLMRLVVVYEITIDGFRHFKEARIKVGVGQRQQAPQNRRSPVSNLSPSMLTTQCQLVRFFSDLNT